jgi:integrase
MATTRIHLTVERIRKLIPPNSTQAVYVFDDDPKHLSVRVTPAGAKSFVYSGKLNGTPLRVTIGSASDWILEDARAEARRLQTLVDAGRDPRQVKADITAADEAARAAAFAAKTAAELEAQRQQLTLGEAWAVYCEARRPKWGERTARDHEKLMQLEHTKANGRQMKAGVLASLATEPLCDVTAPKVGKWLDHETKERPTQAALGYRLLRAFLNWCADHPDYSNIAAPDACTRKVSKEHLPKSKAKDDALQREQLRTWFDCVHRIPNRTISAYLQILLLVGCRREELATLRWENVDFQWNSLTIRDKVEGERTIPMTPYVRSLLLELKARNETKPAATRILRGKRISNDLDNWKPSQWVFVAARRSSDGEFDRMTEPSIAHRKALAAAGLPPVSLHGLRRSFGSLSEWVEVPVGIVAQIQGHKPSATAEKHYRVRPLDLLRMWHTKIEGWILEQAGITQPHEATAPALRAIGGGQ